MEYTKQPLEIDDLVEMLKGRGPTITDEKAAKEQLANASYFRLAGYLRPMERDKGEKSLVEFAIRCDFSQKIIT